MRRCIDEAYDNGEGRHTVYSGGEDADDNVSEAAEGMRVGTVRFEAVTGTGK